MACHEGTRFQEDLVLVLSAAIVNLGNFLLQEESKNKKHTTNTHQWKCLKHQVLGNLGLTTIEDLLGNFQGLQQHSRLC